MKSKFLLVGFGLLFLNASVVFAELDSLENFDNFNAKKYKGCKNCINPDNWYGGERFGSNSAEAVREIKSKRLHMSQRTWGEGNTGTGKAQGRNRLHFRNSANLSGVCFTPRIKKYEINNCAANDAEGSARFRYLGTFFDADDQVDDGDTGSIYAGIAMVRSGNTADKKGVFRIKGAASECQDEGCEVDKWSTYDGDNDPDLDFGPVKGAANKKSMCVGYDKDMHQLMFSYGNDVRFVDATHDLPLYEADMVSRNTWHVIEARNDVENCPTGRITGFVDGDIDNVKIRRFSGDDISGVWTTRLADNDLLAFVFFEDGTYVHLEIDEKKPFDQKGEKSGMEWGTYSRDSDTGQLTVTQVFDANEDTGLNDATNLFTNLYAQVYGDTLVLQFDDNNDGEIGRGESLGFSRAVNDDLLGAWTTDLTDNDLLALVFFADGTYVHLEIDEEAPIDEAGETSGMEWGTYTRDSDTGQLTVTQTFDANGDTGLTDATLGLTDIFAQVSGDTLTMEFDDNLNGTIEGDESLDFERAF